jgi:hypothetical protein
MTPRRPSLSSELNSGRIRLIAAEVEAINRIKPAHLWLGLIFF